MLPSRDMLRFDAIYKNVDFLEKILHLEKEYNLIHQF